MGPTFVAGNALLVVKVKKVGESRGSPSGCGEPRTPNSVPSWSTRRSHAQGRYRPDRCVYAMTMIARLVAACGVAFIVLLVITHEWYYGLRAFFALAIVLPAARATSD